VRKVSIKGVLIGGIVDIVTSVVFGMPFGLYAASKVDLARIPKDQVEAAISAAMRGNVLLSDFLADTCNSG